MAWVSTLNPCPACQQGHTLRLATEDRPTIHSHFIFICPEKGLEVQLNRLAWDQSDQCVADSIAVRPATWGGGLARSENESGGRASSPETP